MYVLSLGPTLEPYRSALAVSPYRRPGTLGASRGLAISIGDLRHARRQPRTYGGSTSTERRHRSGSRWRVSTPRNRRRSRHASSRLFRVGEDVDVFRFESGRPLQPLLASSLDDSAAQFSHDGRHIAFVSERSGGQERSGWPSADGSNLQQLTHGPGPWQGARIGRRTIVASLTMRWRPMGDGTSGRSTLMAPRRVKSDGPGEQNVPTWSSDGRWIYFSVDQGAGREIWRVPAAGGRPEQITRRGSGYLARDRRRKEPVVSRRGLPTYRF